MSVIYGNINANFMTIGPQPTFWSPVKAFKSKILYLLFPSSFETMVDLALL